MSRNTLLKQVSGQLPDADTELPIAPQNLSNAQQRAFFRKIENNPVFTRPRPSPVVEESLDGVF
ncbi:MAG: hypothetical protein ACR2P1_26790 [Pseudomonadales bacterium]